MFILFVFCCYIVKFFLFLKIPSVQQIWLLEPSMASVPCSLKCIIKIGNVKKYNTSVVMAVACFHLALV